MYPDLRMDRSSPFLLGIHQQPTRQPPQQPKHPHQQEQHMTTSIIKQQCTLTTATTVPQRQTPQRQTLELSIVMGNGIGNGNVTPYHLQKQPPQQQIHPHQQEQQYMTSIIKPQWTLTTTATAPQHLTH